MKRQAESQDVVGSPAQQTKVGRKPGPTGPRLKVICYSCPMMGHVTPTLSIANALAKKGHEVLFVSSEALARKVAERCRRNGVTFRGLTDSLTEKEVEALHPGEGPVFMNFTEKHGPSIAELVKAFQPSVVVSDFASGAGLIQAQEMGLPLVINVPMPASLLKKSLLLANPAVRYVVKRWVQPADKDAIHYLGCVAVPAIKSAISVVNSSPALDGRVALPPNIFISGPLDGFSAKPLLPSHHADILQFVTTTKAMAKPLFYITTGSLMDLSKEQVLALYEGFESCNVRVLWSLKAAKQGILPHPLSANFLISAWMPQVEILSLKELTAVLTHCGWGGSLECMMASKPVICFPGFGDQEQNARILNDKGCGPLLKPSSVTAKAVSAAVNDVLTNLQTYQENARRISDELQRSPGPEATVELIEQAAKGLPPMTAFKSEDPEPSRCVIC